MCLKMDKMNITLNDRFLYALEAWSYCSGICIVLESHSALGSFGSNWSMYTSAQDCHLNWKATSAASEVLCYGWTTLVLLKRSEGMHIAPETMELCLDSCLSVFPFRRNLQIRILLGTIGPHYQSSYLCLQPWYSTTRVTSKLGSCIGCWPVPRNGGLGVLWYCPCEPLLLCEHAMVIVGGGCVCVGVRPWWLKSRCCR